MSDRSKRITKRINDALIEADVGFAFVQGLKKNITKGVTGEGAMKPLKDITGGTRKRGKRAGEKYQSYRNGGKPLRNTGESLNDISGTTIPLGGAVEITVRGPIHMMWQHHGFKTQGPNFIPLTRKAARTHRTGANPVAEGLKPGKDYIMAWSGVDVPARPWMTPTKENLEDLGDLVAKAIRRSMMK